MKSIIVFASALVLATTVSAEVFLYETFSDKEGWQKRWAPSTYREDLGIFKVSPGQWFTDKDEKAGLQTTEDYRFYAVSTPMKPFNNLEKDLVVQFDVKNEQNIDCGGSYIKLFSPKFDPKTFNGDSEYNIMFGPDICGTKAIVHVIFSKNGSNHSLKKTVIAPKDTFTHTYTLHVKPDQSYRVIVDGIEQLSGSLLEDWDMVPSKTIPDPHAKKPVDWVNSPKINDPEDKPTEQDNIPEFVSDPSAERPDDWDDEMDGEWEAPSIPNPEFKGEWSPKKIPNPDYKGPWVHPEIPNPLYKLETDLHAYDFGYLGIDIWQVKSGTIFDNLLVTDDIEEAEKIRLATAALEEEKEALKVYEENQSKKNQADVEVSEGIGLDDIDLDEEINAELEDKNDQIRDEL
ncbi:Calnexin [Phycomyces blakesleeanus]|uniref:Calreticulin n=2 Tax=Phycomyces blakesleeanus TaxID=4837 RepID=A0A162YFF9_PHYB8|nr:Calnexin [Phycomyces blakesleeanus NRRL 1555(-)]OAD80345.1 Calnexin [Phycomyces blakesleeanus NRRL 1555(-)]|eukprot:XP_018298385.1 Calnexin [Phycomyces blakesleeanus NRRL 1555(-)]